MRFNPDFVASVIANGVGVVLAYITLLFLGLDPKPIIFVGFFVGAMLVQRFINGRKVFIREKASGPPPLPAIKLYDEV